MSRGSLYYKRLIPEKDEELRRQIEAVMIENPGYGYRRVADALCINHKRAMRVMKKFGLKPARRANSPRKPLDEGKAACSYPVITQVLCPIAPNVVWVSDFTFISFQGKFLYLATVIDLFTGEVLGFSIMKAHNAELIIEALERAAKREGCYPEWFHSDQGSEYDSDRVSKWLNAHQVQISMSPKASPWRNGSQESFFGRFKVEIGDFDRFERLSELLEEIFQFIAYYNQVRIKNKLRMSPTAFRKKWEERHRKFSTLLPGNSQLMSLPPWNPPPSLPVLVPNSEPIGPSGYCYCE